MTMAAYMTSAYRLGPGGTTYAPRITCSRCGTIDFAGRYTSPISATREAERQGDEHRAHHEREDAIAHDPFHGLTD